MQIVIDIPEESYELLKNGGVDWFGAEHILNAVANGTPHSKTGHWIKYSISRCGEQHYKCTSCGYYINFGQWGELYTKEFKFCPNCGVRMTDLLESDE